MTVQSELLVIFKGEDKGLSAAAKGIGSSFGKLGGVVKAGMAIGVAGIGTLSVATVGIGSKLIGLGSDAEEMLGKFNVVFAETGGRVTEELAAFGEEVGRSKFELQGMASVFGDTFKPLGFAEEAAADMSVQMSILATDLGSFNDMPMDESLQRLQSTLIGNHENALAFGVIINENTLKAELAANGWDNLTGSALEQAKVQARMNLLLAGTSDAQGDAARTSKSWANQKRKLVSTIKDAATELGMKLLPALTPVLELIGKLATQAVPVLTAGFEKILPFIEGAALFIQSFAAQIQWSVENLGFFDGILTAVGNALASTGLISLETANSMWAIIDSVINVKNQIVEFMTPIVEWIQQNIQLKDVLIALGIVLGAVIVSAIASLIAAIAPVLVIGAALIGLVALIRTAWENNWGGIQEKVAAVVAWFQETLIPWLQDTLIPLLKEKITEALQALSDFWTNTLQPAIAKVWEWLSTVLIPFITGTLIPFLQEKIPLALQALSDFWTNTLQPAIQTVWTWLSTVLIPFITGTLIPMLAETIGEALTTLADFWTNTLQPAIKDVWEFLTVDMMPIWEALGELLGVAIPLVLTALQGIWENVLLPAMKDVWEFVDTKLGPIFQWLKDEIFDKVTASAEGLSDKIASIASKIRELADALGNISLPDWMTPGSPTPWELGLVGVRKQMALLTKGELPGLNVAMQNANQGIVTNDNRSTTIYNNIYTSGIDVQSENRMQQQFAFGGI